MTTLLHQSFRTDCRQAVPDLSGEKSCVSRHPGIACLAFRRIEGRTLCHSDEYQNLFSRHFDSRGAGREILCRGKDISSPAKSRIVDMTTSSPVKSRIVDMTTLLDCSHVVPDLSGRNLVYPVIPCLPVSPSGESKDEHFVILMNIRISSPVISTNGRNLLLKIISSFPDLKRNAPAYRFTSSKTGR